MIAGFEVIMPTLQHRYLQRMVVDLLVQDAQKPLAQSSSVGNQELLDCLDREAKRSQIDDQAGSPDSVA
jgi:hypothetical protein